MNSIKYFVVILLVTCSIKIITVQNVPSYVPANGLVGWWPFSGDTNDESGNDLNGALIGGVGGILPVLAEDRFSNSNSAYSFTGQGEYIIANAGQ
jgi:hypothetical protein